MIVLVGVGHVFDISSKVKGLVQAYRPEMVCVELDAARYEALRSGNRDRGGLFDSPIIFQILGKIQDTLAKQYNVMAGEEMLSAVDAANEVGARVALIDMDIYKLVQRFRDPKTVPEKLKLLLSIVSGLFLAKTKNIKGKSLESEIADFEKNPEKYIDELEREFPILKEELIDKRNEYMSKGVIELNRKYRKLMVFVGAGHLGGMNKILKGAGKEPYIVKLGDIMQGGETKFNDIVTVLKTRGDEEDKERAVKLAAQGEGAQVSYSVNVSYDIEGENDDE